MYDFKVLPELGFAAAVAVLTALLQILVDFDASVIGDWETWAISAGSAAARAAAVAMLAVLGKSVLAGEGGEG